VKVLVTGGAGYIGSHIVRLLIDRGDSVVIADDLVSGVRARVPGVPLLQLDLAAGGSVKALESFIEHEGVDAVIHLAARKAVGESVARPIWYYRENIVGLATVLEAMESVGISRLVFSSSAAVYGDATGVVSETTPAVPASPYGSTKLVGEWLISDAVKSSALRAISLRYFNVAGAGWAELGDRAVANLVPMVFQRIDAGESPQIFGGDFPTPDGTCIRDYVHVLDLAEAHLAALDHIDDLDHAHRVYNVGTGTGTSVREMIDAILDAAKSKLLAEVVSRRAGDPAELIASADRIRMELGWSARFSLDEIVNSAWNSHELLLEAT
jgi:UDP-glucose 4-epimerase